MFNQITWAGYCTALLILLLSYYLCVLFFYFKNEIIQLISGKQELFARTGSAKSGVHFTMPAETVESHPDASFIENNIHQANLENGLFQLVHDLTNELQIAIREAGEKAYKKEELIFSLQLLLKTYRELKGTNFTEAINSLIAVECQNSCSIHLDEDELNMLWVQ